MQYVPLSKRAEQMTHESFLQLDCKEMLKASDKYMKALGEIAGKTKEERLSYFYKNRKKLTVAGRTSPEHDDILALCSIFGYEQAVSCKGMKNKALKRLVELADTCNESHSRNAKSGALSPSSYDDLLGIAKRCLEIVQDNQ